MEIVPSKQNISELFASTSFHIDFYQREYQWTATDVQQLLDDIFYTFDQAYPENTSLDPNLKNVSSKYPWYYLNTYITNKTDGQLFIVDGQQRLTTITLILISLYRLCEDYGLTGLRDWIQTKIVGIGVGGAKQFWIAHEKRHIVMEALMNNSESAAESISGITGKHMIENFQTIDQYLKSKISSKHRLETFIYYFLCMVVIVNLDVPDTDVPMVFEVINDRGKKLQPYEILKGKLLGEIDKSEVDGFADIWESSLLDLEESDKEDVDTFFRTYFRAKFADNRKLAQNFDGPYHRTIFDERTTGSLFLESDAMSVKEFLRGPFRYYSKLYIKLRDLSQNESATIPEYYFISQLNRMDGHLMLAMAACEVDDPEEDAKIVAVGRGFDRAYVALQLNRAYDSNQFQELLYSLNPSLRGSKAEQIEGIIDDAVINEIKARRNSESTSLIQYSQFKQVGYGDYNPTFLRYFLTRIEKYVANGMGWSMQDSLYNYVRGIGKSNAYHIEHILARNDESKSLFTSDGVFDETRFENERNRFGALLLLKGQDNQSSKAEPYKDKLRTYTGSAPYLAQSLVANFYKSNSAMKTFEEESGLKLAPIDDFSLEALEARSELIYSIVQKIWL
jgi:hypothetical protein